ncbi:MAG: hypothetical protein CL678_10985 [Bdellovibrionaceae bacterium]|nr:hypothetical protein [Pseudobdellovibrionaceae bacterium]
MKFRVFFALICGLSLFGCASSRKKSVDDLSARERSSLYLNIANGSLVEQDPTGALMHLQKAEKEDPTFAQVHHVKALAYYAKHDLGAAIESARKALSIEPKFSAARTTLAKLLLDQKKYDEAIEVVLPASKDLLYRNSYKAKTILGMAYYHKKIYKDSLTAFNAAILEKPEHACVAHFFRGTIRFRLKKYLLAEKDFKKSIQNNCSSFAKAHFALGMTLKKTNKTKEAKLKFIEIQQLFPDSQFAKKAMKEVSLLP